MHKEEVLKHFHLLADYFQKTGRIADISRCRTDFLQFLLHAGHVTTYDFAVPYCRDKKVLDIGCSMGTGEWVLARTAKEITAVDENQQAIDFARSSNTAPNVQFVQTDARDLPFPDDSFDVVLAFQLIEHIPPKDVQKFLSEAKRVLKPRGQCIIVTPNRKFRLLPFQKPFNPEHYREFSARALRRTLKRFFREIRIRGTRAIAWIELSERKRIRKSPFEIYLRRPFFRFLKFLTRIKKSVFPGRLGLVTLKQPPPEKQTCYSPEEFNKLFDRFEPENFFLEDGNINKSVNLFAICRK